MVEVIKLPQTARDPLAWSVMLLLAALAWIPTLGQTLSMLAMPMYGTMDLALLPFLLFWTLMMVGMMLPSLAPTVSMHLTFIQRQSAYFLTRSSTIACFLVGYLAIWLLFGIPVFLLCALGDHCVRSAPALGIALGMIIFVGAGVYQFTPLKRQTLTHCHVAVSCPDGEAFLPAIFSYGKAGLLQGISCLQYCGPLMLVMVAVGLMNLVWMLLLTAVIFIEKVWFDGNRLSSPIGVVLIMYGLLAFVDPALLAGLYVH
jgi:predicted metal-binding membrane protein